MSTAWHRDGLLRRIRQIRSADAVRDSPPDDAAASNAEPLRELETRVAHLEQLVEGLQDSVHRESHRHEALIAEIQTQIQPGAMGVAIADDERHRRL